MEKLSKETIMKLRAIKNSILAEPNLYDQENPPNYAFGRGGCSDPCCLLGWAAWNNNPDPIAYGEIAPRLRSHDFIWLLGVTMGQAARLFSTYYVKHGEQIPVTDASIGAARIEHFIATDGRE